MAAIVMRSQFPTLLWWMNLGGQGLVCRLYQNNVTPVETNSILDFTECDFAGYEQRPLTSWNRPVLAGDNAGLASHATLKWTYTGGASQPVYGYYVTDSEGSYCFWAEKRPAPLVLAVEGEKCLVTIRLTLRNDAIS